MCRKTSEKHGWKHSKKQIKNKQTKKANKKQTKAKKGRKDFLPWENEWIFTKGCLSNNGTTKVLYLQK
jgi:hypothetical protein